MILHVLCLGLASEMDNILQEIEVLAYESENRGYFEGMRLNAATPSSDGASAHDVLSPLSTTTSEALTSSHQRRSERNYDSEAPAALALNSKLLSFEDLVSHCCHNFMFIYLISL
jgi:hypothetical protein